MIDFDLTNAIEGEELSFHAYNPDDYPGKEVLIDHISLHCNERAENIDLKALSINGMAKRDDMEMYLNNKNISSSNLKNALKSPRSFYYDYEKVFEEKEKKCFEIGTFAHMAFLEPVRFKMVRVLPRENKSELKGMVNLIRFLQELNEVALNDLSGLKMQDLRLLYDSLMMTSKDKGYSFIDEETKNIIDALEKNYYWYGGGVIPQILKGAYSEVSFYGTDRETGLKVKVRPDYFNVEENIGVNAVISFKTTRADELGKFYYDSAKHKYELSEGMYQEVMSEVTGKKFNVTIMIMLQTVPPYDVAVLFWHPDDLANGKYKYRHALSVVKECVDKKTFPGYDAMAEDGARGIIDMKQPHWASRELYPIAIEE